jgi:4a-hydroxytetrahydrobiopterin dehydratase
MASLTDMKCEACRKDSPRVTNEQLEIFRPQLPEWRIVEVDGVQHLTRTFSFKDFAGALAFTNRVGELAESENHHPAILTEWGKVTVSWWTHAIGGLHVNDFILAARTDRLMT